jgi:hypothetical protein
MLVAHGPECSRLPRHGALHHAADPPVPRLGFLPFRDEAHVAQRARARRRGGEGGRAPWARCASRVLTPSRRSASMRRVPTGRGRSARAASRAGRARPRSSGAQGEAPRRRRQRRRDEHRLLERVDPLAARRDGGHDRDTHLVDQRGHVDRRSPCPAAASNWLSAMTTGNAELADLAREEQVPLEMRRIDDDEHDLRPPVLAWSRPSSTSSAICLVGRAGGERVAAGEVEHRDAAPVGHAVRPFDALDGDAGEVADALPESGQRVEEGRLPGVRIADDGNAQRLGGGEPLRPDGGAHVSSRRVPADGR